MDSEGAEFKEFHVEAQILTHLRHVGEPLQDGKHTLKVIWHRGVRDSIVVHDLDPSQLVVGSVNFPA